jgi:hypothetical protein
MRLALVSLAVVGLLACGNSGGSKDCASLCKLGQSGKCTAIKGDCTAFCNAMDTLAGPANCSSQKTAYQNCLGSNADVCAASCSSQETATTTCYSTYCLGHLTDKDCLTMMGSF